MDRLRFGIWLLAGLLFVALPLPVHADTSTAAATPIDVVSAVNMAGRQRMLSQRMVKAYLMLGQGIAPEDARTLLQGSIAQFEAHLAALKAFQPTPKVRHANSALEGEWAKCKARLTAPPSRTGAVELYDAGEALQQAAHSVVLAYVDVNEAAIDHLVGLVGRQRMLSQRMAKFYFYRSWGLYDAPADMELHLSRAQFTASLIQIDRSPLVSVQAKAALAQLRREWEPYQQTLFASHDPLNMRSDAARVAQLSELVLAATEDLVAQLVAQSPR
ncbi:MAG: type IV pili methyl-accepting chemotaxis transducer N-terminal domain-containing protein [Gammaproteobacteria bacterium]|jgi:hypothetical protein|nr:type IV pili methyl-accepting chemotaxis transducer N-terminal domain-containing protein [Gammaproteobacteria bacterium]MBP6050399.1 type IV pili methyl-accepting chemotaxis transducer N-terminal domain-containing protein [Pseudomonadales bacterium]MBK7170299.1 type IV pili methyl-accepting chemotaxis transducer N-terminal domain-containing protein [Gammaproteobacteria bacterium]MBK7522021.1 type IV pili methyl-accepting chemotaxis transducer N-terminal domain-containing protein [Gammaproteob